MRAIALALLLTAPAVAADERPATTLARIPAEQAAVALAEARGRLIYAYDQAAWHGTDDMLVKVQDPATKVAGYLADGPAEAPQLIFYDRQPTPQAYYVALFRGNRLVSGRVLGPNEDRALPSDALRRLRALAVATAAMRSSGLRACNGQPFNSVVLPSDPSGSVRVYLLTPQTSNAQLPLGGHYAIDVAANGTAGQPRPFMQSCMDIAMRPPPRRNGAAALGVSVSHLLDPTPTEIHVFTSMALPLPIIVATMQPTLRLWTVEGGRISGPRPTAR